MHCLLLQISMFNRASTSSQSHHHFRQVHKAAISTFKELLYRSVPSFHSGSQQTYGATSSLPYLRFLLRRGRFRFSTGSLHQCLEYATPIVAASVSHYSLIPASPRSMQLHGASQLTIHNLSLRLEVSNKHSSLRHGVSQYAAYYTCL
ncbi:hypothetical protein CPC08DRAFT_71412 [Agrocybe pediades]|nr:hypothetical protein CPC08DRAFT_71412 [Agrocybe pediades]